MTELGMEIGHIDYGFMSINSKKILTMFCRIQILELIIPLFKSIGPSTFMGSNILIIVYNNITVMGAYKKRLLESLFLFRAQNVCLTEKNMIIIMLSVYIFPPYN